MNISLICPINKLSYGYLSLNILKELSKNHNVSLWPIGGIEYEPKYHSLIKLCIANTGLFDVYAPAIRIFHQHSLDLFPGRGKKIGYSVFELDTFSDVEKHHLSSCDELIVCSQWAKDVCINNGISIPIHIVNLGVDTNIFYPKPMPNSDIIRFFNIAKYEKRKSHDIISNAFIDAFKDKKDVSLFYLGESQLYTPEENREWASKLTKDPLNRIKCLNRLSSLENIADLINLCHCGVFPSRAEGWNMPLSETLACGRYAIATDVTAHSEYITADNSLVVKTNGLVTASDNKWFRNSVGNWYDVDYSSLVNQFQAAYEYVKKNNVLNEAGISTAIAFSWENSAQKIINAIA